MHKLVCRSVFIFIFIFLPCSLTIKNIRSSHNKSILRSRDNGFTRQSHATVIKSGKNFFLKADNEVFSVPLSFIEVLLLFFFFPLSPSPSLTPMRSRSPRVTAPRVLCPRAPPPRDLSLRHTISLISHPHPPPVSSVFHFRSFFQREERRSAAADPVICAVHTPTAHSGGF